MASVKMQGLPELQKKLRALSFDAQRKGGRFALRKAAQVFRDRAKQNAQRFDDPETARSIARNIVERWDPRYFKRTKNLKFRVGVMGGARKTRTTGRDDTWYWRFLEFGTEKMRAQPFMRPAGEQGAQPATDVFISEFGKSIDRTLRRLKK